MASNQNLARNVRNYGIDLLRVVSMIMILCMHMLEHGGIIENLEVFTLNYNVFWLLELFTYCGVNCYALVSGYVNCNTKGYHFSRIIILWLQVVFYGLLITAVIAMINPSAVGFSQILNAITPVIHNQYWYFTAYFCLFFFMPALNTVINCMSKKHLTIMIWSIVGLFCFIPTLSNKDPFIIKYGFSTIWLACCYLIGGYIKKYGIHIRIQKYGMIVFLLCIISTYLVKMGIEYFSNAFNHFHTGNLLVNYTSPTILLGAVALLAYFANNELCGGAQGFIRFTASTSFGVYLIHEQPLFREMFVMGRFTGLLTINPFLAVVIIILVAIVGYMVMSCIDWLRIQLFKLIRLKPLFNKLDIAE